VRLIPRDEGFFALFEQLAEKLTASTKEFELLLADPQHRDVHVARIKEIERQADEITRDVIQRLDRSFVTPLDREDIHLLVSRLDNVVDLVDGAARRMVIFRVTEVREPARRLANVLQRATTVIASAVREVRQRQAVIACGFEVKRLEEEGDAVYSEAISGLFDGSQSPIDVITWMHLFDRIEDAIDECEDVANVLESVSLKNS
jgi:predicted phosphate transport protein (TIGR00153 family)